MHTNDQEPQERRRTGGPRRPTSRSGNRAGREAIAVTSDCGVMSAAAGESGKNAGAAVRMSVGGTVPTARKPLDADHRRLRRESRSGNRPVHSVSAFGHYDRGLLDRTHRRDGSPTPSAALTADARPSATSGRSLGFVATSLMTARPFWPGRPVPVVARRRPDAARAGGRCDAGPSAPANRPGIWPSRSGPRLVRPACVAIKHRKFVWRKEAGP